MCGTDDEKRGARKASARCEKSVDDQVDAGERAMIADVTDDEFVFESKLRAKSTNLFGGDVAEFRKICAVGQRQRIDGAFAGEFFAERLGDGKNSVHLRGNAAQVGTDFCETFRSVLVLGKPIDNVESRPDVKDAIGAEKLGGIENMCDLVSFDDGEQGFAIAPLAKSQRTRGAKNTVKKNRLPDGEFDGSEIVARRDGALRAKNRRSGDGKLFRAAEQGGCCVNMKRICPLEYEDLEVFTQAAREFEFTDGDVFGVDVRNDEEPKFWRRRSHYRSAELRPAC